MPKVRFRGAELRSITGNMEEGGIIYRLHFVTTLSDKVAEVMNWDVLDEKGMLRDGLENPKLAGILRTDLITLEPNGLSGEDKEKHSLQIEVIEVSGFQAITKKGDESREVYLKFTARSNVSFSPVEKWWKKWGQSPCLCIADGVLQASITDEEDGEEEEAGGTTPDTPETPGEPKKRGRKTKQAEFFTEEEKKKMAPAIVE